MNLEKFLLSKLGDTLLEATRVVMNGQSFGMSQKDSVTGVTNLEALVSKLNDIKAVTHLLQKEGVDFKGLGDPAVIVEKAMSVMVSRHVTSIASPPIWQGMLDSEHVAIIDWSLRISFKEYNEMASSSQLRYFLPMDHNGNPTSIEAASTLMFWRMPIAQEVVDPAVNPMYGKEDWLASGWVLNGNGRASKVKSALCYDRDITTLFYSNINNELSIRMPISDRKQPFRFS